MKKNTILILLYLAVSVSNSSNAYFYADTNSIAPVAYYAEDSLTKRIGHENPISTIAAVLPIAVPITLGIGAAGPGYGLIFDPFSLVLAILVLSPVCWIIGFGVRNKLMAGKYANSPEPQKLPLGQGRSILGILGSLAELLATVVTVASCYI